MYVIYLFRIIIGFVEVNIFFFFVIYVEGFFCWIIIIIIFEFEFCYVVE